MRVRKRRCREHSAAERDPAWPARASPSRPSSGEEGGGKDFEIEALLSHPEIVVRDGEHAVEEWVNEDLCYAADGHGRNAHGNARASEDGARTRNEERHQPPDGGDRDIEQDHENEQQTEHPPPRASGQLP